jgi:hypothetical protein
MTMKLRFVLFAITVAVIGLSPRLFAADSEVKGSFIGDGKAAKLAFVSAHKGATVANKETVKLVFTERDHSKEKSPNLKAFSGDFGSALVVTIYLDSGRIVGCDVAHEAHAKKPFLALQALTMSDFKNEGGLLSGKFATAGKVETFGQTWEVDLTFRAKLQ